ncbi:MAG: Obg family GTPase CgtA, partial [Patescibacteria group bacterium]
ISAPSRRNITELLRQLKQKVEKARAEALPEEIDEDEIPTISLSDEAKEKSWSVEKIETGIYHVKGDKIEKFARRTNYDSFEGVNRLRDIMRKLGINHELTRQGATGESIIRIGSSEFTFIEQ